MKRHELVFSNRSRVFGKNRITTNNRALQNQQRTQQRMLLHENGRGNTNAKSPTPKKAQDNDKENKENQDVKGKRSSPDAANTEIALTKLERQQMYLKRFVEWKQQKKLNEASKQLHQPILPAMVKPPSEVNNEKNTATNPSYKGRRSVYELKATSTVKPLNESSNVNSKSQATVAVVQPRKLDFSTLAINNNKLKLQAKKDTANTTAAASATTTNTMGKKLQNVLTTGFDGGKIVSNVVNRGAAAKAHQMMQRKKTSPAKTNKPARLATNLKAKNLQANSMAAHIKRFKKQDIGKVTSNDAAYNNKTKAIKELHKQNNNNNNNNSRNNNNRNNYAIVAKNPVQGTITKETQANIVKNNAMKAILAKIPPKIKVTAAKATKVNSLKTSELPQQMKNLKAIQTPLDVLRSTGKFDPSVTSTQERVSAHFDFENACSATNAFAKKIHDNKKKNKSPTAAKSTPATSKNKTENSAQRKLLRQYAVDVDFVRNDSVYGDGEDSQTDEEATKINNNKIKPAEDTMEPTSEQGKKTFADASAQTRVDVVDKSATAKLDTIRAIKRLSVETAKKPDPVESEKLRTLQAIRKFRQQLAEEILRLHKLCYNWTTYRDANLQELQRNGADDMINVTIGQTKLLTSKKFQQFSGLIDRCEARVTDENSIINDGSEDTKPITPIDLEGFWSMLGLQVANIDQRFQNLEKWKLNNWLDPEIIKAEVPKVVQKLTKKKVVAKSKANSAIRELIRQKQAEMRKKKEANNEDNSVIVLTPSKKSKQNSAKKASPRRSILIKDRKQFSNSPTILLMSVKKKHNNSSRNSTPNKSGRSSLSGGSSPKENKARKGSEISTTKSMGLLRSALKGATEQQHRRSLTPLGAHAPLTPKTSTHIKCTPKRKSILKTPGIDQSAMKRQVSFNLSSMFRSIKFVHDTSDIETDTEDKP